MLLLLFLGKGSGGVVSGGRHATGRRGLVFRRPDEDDDLFVVKVI